MLRQQVVTRLSAVGLAISTTLAFAADENPIARVGDQALSAGMLRRRLAKMPDFQRAALGVSAEQLKRQVLESELVPELLYAQEATRQKLAERISFRQRQREVLRDALERQLGQESEAQSPITDRDIHAYFEANRSRFETPRRLHLWRILCDDEASAKKVIAESKGPLGVQRWSQFAREHSRDAATRLRNGELGFVHPDGNTDTPTLRVDPALFAAADKWLDGELSPEPLKEGRYFAVIWRRGSMKAVNRTLAQEERAIRQVLARKRLEQARSDLLDRLSAKYVSARNEPLLETFRFDAQGLPNRQQPPPLEAHAARAGSSPPRPTERGER